MAKSVSAPEGARVIDGAARRGRVESALADAVAQLADAEARDLAAKRRDLAALDRDARALVRDRRLGRSPGAVRDDEARVAGRRRRVVDVAEPLAVASGGEVIDLSVMSEIPDPDGMVSGLSRFLMAAAALDRELAARDREAAAADREAAAADRTLASRDELTGALRRAEGMARLAGELNRGEREGWHVVVAYLDVDRLKAVNDVLGHAAGDAVLVRLVEVAQRCLRSYDEVIRLGGDEFCFVLPRATLDEGTRRVEDVRRRLRRGTPALTVSVGLAVDQPGDTAERLVDRADATLLAGRAANSKGRPDTAARAPAPGR